MSCTQGTRKTPSSLYYTALEMPSRFTCVEALLDVQPVKSHVCVGTPADDGYHRQLPGRASSGWGLWGCNQGLGGKQNPLAPLFGVPNQAQGLLLKTVTHFSSSSVCRLKSSIYSWKLNSACHFLCFQWILRRARYHFFLPLICCTSQRWF